MVSIGSRIRFHPAFEQALDELVAVVAKEKQREPEKYKKSPQTRLLAAIYRAMKDEIPAHPGHASYFQGETGGYAYRQWRRAKPSGKYRLFFKCVEGEDVIVYAWLNNEISLRKYQGHLDACAAFRKRQLGGNGENLLATEARSWGEKTKRLKNFFGKGF